MVPVSDLIRELKLRPEEVASHAEIATLPPQTKDLETLCKEAIASLKLKGKTVLDIGGYDGRMAAYALECGAKKAICLDNQQWEHYGWTEKDKLAGVEYVTGDFMDFCPAGPDGITCPHEDDDTVAAADFVRLPRPDVVIFYNVLYHVRNPWVALEHLHGLVKPKGTMLLCSLVRFDDLPRWYLYEPNECNPEDDTVYWGPSKAGLLRLLRLTGWKVEEVGQAVERLVLKCRKS